MWVLICVIFVGTFVFLFIKSKPQETVYTTTRASYGDIERNTVLTGKIEPRDEIEIKPQISGIITEINVDAGTMVHEGDVIARIKVIPEASSLSSAHSRVEQAQISLADAKLKLDRAEALYARKVISREEYEDAERTHSLAQQELDAATDSYAIVKDGVSRYNASESNTLVRATITGLVLDVPVKVGSSVIQANTFNDGTTIATIADMNKLIFKGSVDETEVGLLSVGMPMTISIGAAESVKPSGVIEYIAPKGTDSSGANTFEIKAALSDIPEDVMLRAGYSANATVTLDSRKDVLSLPENYVEFAGDSTFVYVLEGEETARPQKFERHAVSTGLSNGMLIEIKEGIDSTTVLRADLVPQK